MEDGGEKMRGREGGGEEGREKDMTVKDLSVFVPRTSLSNMLRACVANVLRMCC